MRIRFIILVSTVLAAGAVLAQAYRWVDEDGVIHFSDKPHEGAELIILPSDKRVSRRQEPGSFAAAGTPGSAPEQPTEEAADFSYESLSIVSPGAEQTLWNIEGVLNVTLDLRPGLREGHQVRLFVDGDPLDPVATTSIRVQEVWRGVHNIQAEVVDATGRLMIRSQPNRFYVQQNTINRARPGG
jgi:hypothetical protein